MTSRHVLSRGIGLVAAALLVMLATQASAQQDGQSRRVQRGRRGIWGDWQVTTQFGEREMKSILAFSRGEDRTWKGEAISLWGISELQDVKFEEGKLTYTQVFRRGDNEMRWQFAGAIEEGKLTGTLKSERGESKLVGERPPRLPFAVGSWAMVTKAGEREYKGTLVITAGEDGALSGEWKSERAQHTISNLKLERRALTFTRTIKMEDREWTMAFEGELGRDGLTGVFKSDRGEATTTGTRIGAAAIGRWDVEIATENGSRKQRLTVNRDLSGLWGSLPVKKIEIDGDKMSFKAVAEFGDRKWEQSFAGTMKEDTMTGELTSARGTRKVTAKKRPSMFGGRRARPSREPTSL